MKCMDHIDSTYLKVSIKSLYDNKFEFENYKNANLKLAAVKRLKDISGGGLKEAKDVIDLYFDGELKPYVKEERKLKLEKLAKKPLVEQLIIKIRNLEEDKLNLLLMNLSIDQLLSIDDLLPENEINNL